ncbi:hypothetical protein ACED34_25150, partial [Vibrio splendidus]|uniref:hypothetical protein n=1 Tax=Vibrio splendidus TaxID=29497 RepID=UPI00352E4C48
QIARLEKGSTDLGNNALLLHKFLFSFLYSPETKKPIHPLHQLIVLIVHSSLYCDCYITTARELFFTCLWKYSLFTPRFKMLSDIFHQYA